MSNTKYLAIFVVLSLFLAPIVVLSSEKTIRAPETLGDLKTMLLKLWLPFSKGFQAAFGQAKQILTQFGVWIRQWWANNLADKADYWFNGIWQKLKSLFSERKDIFKKELGKEKEEIKEDAKKEIPDLIKKLKEIFK